MPSDELLIMDLAAGADDWSPTPHGSALAEALAASDLIDGRSVLELGAGVGNHTIVIVRKGARSVVATEITAARAATTRANVERNCGAAADRVEYRVADWIRVAGGFDLVVTNPPFAQSGQRNRRYFIDALILGAPHLLAEGGDLLFVQSSMADIAKTMRRLDENGFDAEIVLERSGPFRSYYFDDPSFMEEIKTVPNGFEIRDGTHYETLYVVHGKLRAWSPPATAHLPTEDA